jgi:hypothetical protein
VFQSFSFSLINYTIYTSFKELPPSWNHIAGQDIMLSINYFKALEEASPNNITLYYIGVFKNDELVGLALIERVELYLKDMFRKNAASAVKEVFRDLISRVLRGNVLVVGNLTHTGQHGISFIKDKISLNEYLYTVIDGVNAIKALIKKESKKTIRIIMFKDYFLNDDIHKAEHIFNSEKLNKVTVQPNMVLDIKSGWVKPEDYLNNLNKKYKTRYKRARKKFGTIERKELDIETIQNNSTRLYKLYTNVSYNAKFNTFVLPKNHFYKLKQELQKDFRVFGYYFNETLIGFYTVIINNSVLETYFLGYDSEHQFQKQLYLNMLYDMLEFAIINKFTSVVYARTAMEIKSSVGAKSVPMLMYMKHTNSFANTLLKAIFNFMKPNQKWEERHPFSG